MKKYFTLFLLLGGVILVLLGCTGSEKTADMNPVGTLGTETISTAGRSYSKGAGAVKVDDLEYTCGPQAGNTFENNQLCAYSSARLWLKVDYSNLRNGCYYAVQCQQEANGQYDNCYDFYPSFSQQCYSPDYFNYDFVTHGPGTWQLTLYNYCNGKTIGADSFHVDYYDFCE